MSSRIPWGNVPSLEDQMQTQTRTTSAANRGSLHQAQNGQSSAATPTLKSEQHKKAATLLIDDGAGADSG